MLTKGQGMTRTSKLWAKTVLCLLMLTITTEANTEKEKETKQASDTSLHIFTTYQSMSTEQLQKEVEAHSQKGNLSLALVQELIKRWTKS